MAHPATHSFIVRIWLEETVQQAGHAVWRGQITHVPGGEHRYLQELEEILDFIIPYLETMDVRLGMRWRVRQWLGRFRGGK
jgi:hypothetical protein